MGNKQQKLEDKIDQLVANNTALGNCTSKLSEENLLQQKIDEKNTIIIDYISHPIAIYQDRYIFQNSNDDHQVEIYDINLSKLIGKFSYLGTIQYTSLF